MCVSVVRNLFVTGGFGRCFMQGSFKKPCRWPVPRGLGSILLPLWVAPLPLEVEKYAASTNTVVVCAPVGVCFIIFELIKLCRSNICIL